MKAQAIRIKQTAKQTSEFIKPISFAWWQWIIPPFVGAFATILCYFPSLHYAFQFDDLANITKFFAIRHETLHSLFLKNSRWISYWLNTLYYQWGKFDPFVYRVGNLCFHITTGILLFFVCLLAFSGLKKETFFKRNSWYIACFTLLLFLLHPVQTQTVSYVIQGQLEGLAGLFILLMILLFLLYNRAQRDFSSIVYLGLLLFTTFLACGTKEIVIVSPFLLLLIDWFFVAQGNWAALKKRWWLYGLIFMLVYGMYLYFLKPKYFIKILGLQHETRNNVGNILTEIPLDKIRPFPYCISQFKVILHYLWIFIWPFSISVDYDWVLSKSIFAPDSFIPFIILCILAFLIVRRLKNNSLDLISFCYIWFFIIILPRSSIIPSTELLADYKTYIASCAVFMFLSFGMSKIIEVSSHQKIFSRLKPLMLFLISFLTLAGLLSFLTLRRNTVWRSAEEFWQNIIRNAPLKARAYNNYGVGLSEKGKFNEAIENFKKAIELDKHYPDPCNNLAVAYSAIHQLDLAIEAIKKGIKLQPAYPEGYNNLASFLIQKKEFAGAELALKTAIKLRPHYGKAHFNLGRIAMISEKTEEALAHFKTACMNADFDNEIGFDTYATLCIKMGRHDEAIAAYHKACEILPNASQFVFALATAYFLKKDYDNAQKFYEIALRKGLTDPRVYLYLGETYFAKQDYNKAVVLYEKVIETPYRTTALILKIATCYELMDNNQQAVQVLEKLLSSEKLSADVKEKTERFLKTLKKKLQIK
ncbi:MAG: tetratricopeptide repeat protein [Candidatus Babeliaceae bacterium]